MSDESLSGAAIIYRWMEPTPQQRWPLLEARAGTAVWLKHEHDTPVGSFKVRGGLLYFHELMTRGEPVAGVVAATRGNHGQSVAFAAREHGVPVTVVVPAGNNEHKTRAMRALGASVVERGHDFQAAFEAAVDLAAERQWTLVPSFADVLVRGVATYTFELLRAAPEIETLYVPIGLGSGICGAIAARDALALPTRIVGVVSAGAPAYARSLEAGRLISVDATTRIADGMACRTPVEDALRIIRRGAERILEVTDEQIEAATRAIASDTRMTIEGAGAASVAALLADAPQLRGATTAAVLTGRR